jgi:hypothetical protein
MRFDREALRNRHRRLCAAGAGLIRRGLCETHGVLRAAVVLVVLVAAACGDAGDGAGVITTGSVVDATRSAATARLRLEVAHVAGGWTSTASEGVVDFESGDSELKSGPVGSDLHDGVVVRMVGNEVFLGPEGSEASGGTWVRLSTPADAQALGLVFDPVSIVGELTRSSGDLTAAGQGEVRGEATTVYRFDLESGSRLLPLLAVPADTSVTATMEIDHEGRLRRLVVEPDHPGTLTDTGVESFEYPVPERSELELWHFGVDVNVDAPPQDTVTDFDDPASGDALAAIFEPSELPTDVAVDAPEIETPEPAGPFVKVAEGHWGNVSWEVWQAPTSDTRVCHSIILRPPPNRGLLGRIGIDAGSPGAGEAPGETYRCGPQADLFERGDPVQVLTGWSLDADYWSMLGTAAPEISSLRVELDDGEAIDVPVDPASHVFALFSHAPLSIDKLIPDAGRIASIDCEPEEDHGYGVSHLNCAGTVRRP